MGYFLLFPALIVGVISLGIIVGAFIITLIVSYHWK